MAAIVLDWKPHGWYSGDDQEGFRWRLDGVEHLAKRERE